MKVKILRTTVSGSISSPDLPEGSRDLTFRSNALLILDDAGKGRIIPLITLGLDGEDIGVTNTIDEEMFNALKLPQTVEASQLGGITTSLLTPIGEAIYKHGKHHSEKAARPGKAPKAEKVEKPATPTPATPKKPA